jgi:Domain of unknown function (DUF397)
VEAIDPRWRKSSFSGNGGDCVEVGGTRRVVLVRDTKDCAGPVLRFSPAAWHRFAGQVKRSLARTSVLDNLASIVAVLADY